MGEFDFTYVLVHSIYGDRKSQREAEASQMYKVYNYFQDRDKKEQDILIGGDFNLPGYNAAFKKLFSHRDQINYSLDPINKTSIGKKSLSKPYDNIFYSYRYTKEYTGRVGVYDFTDNDYSEVRRTISDHLPIFIEVETDRDDD